jgi:hypothetical protein
VSYRKIAKDATIVVELLKRIFQCTYCRMLPHFVECSKATKLPALLLDHILDPPQKAIEGVLNPSALKIYAVDVIKAIIAASDEESATVLQALLDFHPAWREYKDQSHDLFLTVSHIFSFMLSLYLSVYRSISLSLSLSIYLSIFLGF